ncbi:valine--tRNA ligase [Patescibacteria group bacterium]|nr:MAG: valine--tRNA ligase [Patescibacteria group bacterium]
MGKGLKLQVFRVCVNGCGKGKTYSWADWCCLAIFIAKEGFFAYTTFQSMAKQDIPKAYEAKNHETAIYDAWATSGFFNPDNLSGEPFSIMMPPPNVTGVLHLGHALENTIMDSMIRYQRMRGRKALLLPGTDHAALPTQAKVEKMLMEEGIVHPRKELGRDQLVEKIRVFAEQSRATILSQIKKLGTSCDWSRLAYTFDEPRNRAVNELFRQMYEDGLVYRGYRVVNWSVKGQSTSSDDEIEHIERTAKLYTFRYSKDVPITIASTRPETKLGDTAIAVHPGDARYASYIGQTFVVDVGALQPLRLKVIVDEHVDPTFGTGALGVTPAHSQIDFSMYETQKAKGDPIDLIPVIGPDGNMTSQAGAYAGLPVEEAREKFVAWLKQEGLLEKEEEITQSVGVSDRYGDVIEAIPMTQWWLNVQKEIPGRGKSLRDLMREALTTGLEGDEKQKISVSPERFTKLYLDRVEHLRDWCLSRQIWWGHRIPVWYKGEEMVVGTQPSGEGWTQDEDTLDTWFSSGSWTFSTLGWPEKADDLKTYHPTSWMQMGYEILYLWLMRMVLMSTYALEEIPFKDVYIHGMLRDKDGRKFSKSLGNGIDPIDIIEKYSADALRFAVVSGVSPGNDSRFYEEKVEAAQRLVNKLWNISRYILTSVEEPVHGRAFKELKPQTLADRWILSRLVRLEEEVSSHMLVAEFSQASEKLREFTWSDFADWYLEASKAQRAEESTKTSTDDILVYVLEHLLTYWHPIMPFVTEQIWSYLCDDELLLAHTWPSLRMIDLDLKAEEEMGWLQETIGGIRTIRSQYAVAPKQKIRVVIVGGKVKEHASVIEGLASISELSFEETAPVGEYASAVVGEGQVFVSLEGLVDKEAEAANAKHEQQQTQIYIKSLEVKLANTEFTSKAPEQVVATMRQNLEEARKKLELYVHHSES